MFHVSALVCLAIVGAQEPHAVAADYVLRNALIVDGAGGPGKTGDLALKNDRIVAVGKFLVAGKPKILDCTGLVLAPGFIDLHTHSDNAMTQPETSPNLNYLTQGVTTAVTGNCGFGPVDVAGYFKKMEAAGIGSNVIHQVPHNALRQQVMGNANRAPTAKELTHMEELVDEGMKAGAYGLATGLIYNPGTYAQTEEIVALAKIVARHGGLYASHIRNEGVDVLVAMEEILTIAARAGIRVHISHIKVSGRRAWGKAGDVISLLRQARGKGLVVTADQYPYIASSTSLTATLIPARYREGAQDDLVKRLDDPKIGPKMVEDIAGLLEDNGPANLRIASYTANPDWQGKDLAAIARLTKKKPLEVVLEITRKGGAGIVNFNMNDEEMRLFMKEPYVATASDGAALLPATTVPHPRSYGTFPRKIGRFALEEKMVTLEQAIRSASGLPADILKLQDRGYLKPGFAADLVVFDPKTFRDQATFDHPHQYATGVRYLFVNGVLTIDEGRYTGARAGKALRHKP